MPRPPLGRASIADPGHPSHNSKPPLTKSRAPSPHMHRVSQHQHPCFLWSVSYENRGYRRLRKTEQPLSEPLGKGDLHPGCPCTHSLLAILARGGLLQGQARVQHLRAGPEVTQASDKGPKSRLYLDPLPHPRASGEKLRNHPLRSNAHVYPVPESQPPLPCVPDYV